MDKLRSFVVVIQDGAVVADANEYSGVRDAVEGFEDQTRRVLASDLYDPGTVVALWTGDDWEEDVGLPLETWTKGVDE